MNGRDRLDQAILDHRNGLIVDEDLLNEQILYMRSTMRRNADDYIRRTTSPRCRTHNAEMINRHPDSVCWIKEHGNPNDAIGLCVLDIC